MRCKLFFCIWIFLTNGVFAAETDEMKTEEVCIEQGKSLHSGVEKYHQINWKLSENRNIATCRGSCEITDEKYRERLKMDNQTGSLTFINISADLTGLYQIQIINKSYKTSYKNFSVTVCEAAQETDNKLKQGLGAGAAAGIGLVLVLLVIVGVGVYCRCRNRKQNGAVYCFVKNGGNVIRRSDEESPSSNNEENGPS